MQISKTITIGILAALGITTIVREMPAVAQNHEHMYEDKMHMNTGSLGTPPGKFHFITPNERTALRFYNQGLEKFGRNDYTGAIAAFTQVLNLIPYYDMASFNRGNAHRQLGEYQAAIEDYSKAIETNPTFTDLRYNRGNLREALGDTKGAIEDYTKAIESYPEEGTGYSDRGLARYKLGDIQGSMADLNEAISVNSGYAGGYVNRAKVYAELGRYQEAIADCQTAKALCLEQGLKDNYLKVSLAMKRIQQQANSAAFIR